MKMDISRVDKLGRTTIPSSIRKTLGLREGDEVEWIVVNHEVMIRKRHKRAVQKIRDRIKELRSSAPKCFTAEEEGETMLGEGLREWSIAKLGLRE